jgi:hypothetical protein
MKTSIIITRKGDKVDLKHFEKASEARNEFRALKESDNIDSAELWDSSNGRTRRIKGGVSKINPAAADRKFYDKPEVKEVPVKTATKKAAKSQSKSE